MFMVIIKRDLRGKMITHTLGPFENRENAEQCVIKAWDQYGGFIIEAKITDVDAAA